MQAKFSCCVKWRKFERELIDLTVRSQQPYFFMIEGACIPCVNLFDIIYRYYLASGQVKDKHVFSCCVVVVSVPLPVTGERRRGSVGYLGKVDPFTVGHLRRQRSCLGQVSDSNARYDTLRSLRNPCITHSWNYSIQHYCTSLLCKWKRCARRCYGNKQRYDMADLALLVWQAKKMRADLYEGYCTGKIHRVLLWTFCSMSVS